MKIPVGRECQYNLVEFKIKHDGCWSNTLVETGSIAHTIIIKPFKERDYVFGGIEVQSKFLKGFRIFYNGFRHSGSIREIIDLETVDSRRKLYRIMFKEKYEDMVSTIMYEHLSVFQSDFIDGTGEEIIAILPQNDIHDAKRELENLGELFYFKIRDVNIDDFVGTNLDLTLQERHALHWAHSSGYYEVPRQVHLEDVAAKVGLSKSALAESLRKAESKVITKWESRHMFLNGLFTK
jgi:predicted DNA binding protein